MCHVHVHRDMSAALSVGEAVSFVDRSHATQRISSQSGLLCKPLTRTQLITFHAPGGHVCPEIGRLMCVHNVQPAEPFC